jgi:hypothetical protein
MRTTMRTADWENRFIAFEGETLIADGNQLEVALRLKKQGAEPALRRGEVLIFAGADGRQIDLHLSGSESDIERRYGGATESAAPIVGIGGKAAAAGAEKKTRGRPKLGVIGREVTLLPRHWAWLDTQRGGASATLRRLVDAERKASVDSDYRRASQDRANRFMSAMAGDLKGFEEATRALYAGNREGFESASASWAHDIRHIAVSMAADAFSVSDEQS